MYEPSQFQFGLGIIGDFRERLAFQRQLTLPFVIRWIKAQNFDDYTKKQLIKRASKYPHNALEQFGDTIELQIVEIQKERVEKERLKRQRNEEADKKGHHQEPQVPQQEGDQKEGQRNSETQASFAGSDRSSESAGEDCAPRSEPDSPVSDSGSGVL
jgi:CRISPR/Cas system CSM-associated protein Csm4 (group 5 of RAMP superfamily)